MGRPRKTIEKIETGSGNVFRDLGFPNPEEHLLKAQLVSRLQQILEERKLTQTAAAKILGLSQPDVSRLLNGQFRDYSVERLLRLLMALDRDIEIVIRPKPQTARRASRLDIVVGT